MIRNACFEGLRRRAGYKFPRLGRAAFELAFKLAPKEIRTELVPGIFATLDLTDEVQRATYWQGERFESPMIETLSRWIDEGATHFFDIGSNYGFFSHALLSRCRTLRAHAFEPNPATFAHLAEIKSQNAMDRLDVWNLGLGDQRAILPFHRGLSDSGHSTFGDHPTLHASGEDQVEVLDFESWRERASLGLPEAANWIAKIDVEGYEEKVLAGMRTALEARAFRGLAIEVNEFTLGFCGSEPAKIYSFLAQVGYHPLSTDGRDKVSAQSCANEFFVPVTSFTKI